MTVRGLPKYGFGFGNPYVLDLEVQKTHGTYVSHQKTPKPNYFQNPKNRVDDLEIRFCNFGCYGI